MRAKVLHLAVFCNLYFDSHIRSLGLRRSDIPFVLVYHINACNKSIVDTKITTSL